MYIESSSRQINDTARLISPVYNKMENGLCFKFFYHMFGASIGQLRVYIKKENDSTYVEQLRPIFSRNGNHGDRWIEGVISVSSIDDYFQVSYLFSGPDKCL